VLTHKTQKEKKMPDNDNDKIRIYEVNKPEGHELLLCYFKPKPDGTYNFHDHGHKVKAEDVTLDHPFHFRFDKDPATLWTLVVTSIVDDPMGEKLGGGWSKSNDQNPALEDGTFQAQAGGSGEEEPNAASAYA
jgi:hypothetical protein